MMSMRNTIVVTSASGTALAAAQVFTQAPTLGCTGAVSLQVAWLGSDSARYRVGGNAEGVEAVRMTATSPYPFASKFSSKPRYGSPASDGTG